MSIVGDVLVELIAFILIAVLMLLISAAQGRRLNRLEVVKSATNLSGMPHLVNDDPSSMRIEAFSAACIVLKFSSLQRDNSIPIVTILLRRPEYLLLPFFIIFTPASIFLFIHIIEAAHWFVSAIISVIFLLIYCFFFLAIIVTMHSPSLMDRAYLITKSRISLLAGSIIDGEGIAYSEHDMPIVELKRVSLGEELPFLKFRAVTISSNDGTIVVCRQSPLVSFIISNQLLECVRENLEDMLIAVVSEQQKVITQD